MAASAFAFSTTAAVAQLKGANAAKRDFDTTKAAFYAAKITGPTVQDIMVSMAKKSEYLKMAGSLTGGDTCHINEYGKMMEAFADALRSLPEPKPINGVTATYAKSFKKGYADMAPGMEDNARTVYAAAISLSGTGDAKQAKCVELAKENHSRLELMKGH